MTAEALRIFRQENGLPETNTLDLFTYFYLQEKASGSELKSVPYPPVYTVEDKYADILSDVEDPAALERYTTPEWKYTYDAFEGKGTISKGIELAAYEDTSRPVDKISITIAPVVKVERDTTGYIKVSPVLRVHSIGAYRPYVKGVILKSGNTVCELTDAVLTGKLSGTQVEEEADIPVSEEALENLLNSEDSTLEIRLKGNSRTYDIPPSVEMQEFAEIMREMI